MTDKVKKAESLFKCYADEGDGSCAFGFCEYCSKLEHCIHCVYLGEPECRNCKYYITSKAYTNDSDDDPPKYGPVRIC